MTQVFVYWSSFHKLVPCQIYWSLLILEVKTFETVTWPHKFHMIGGSNSFNDDSLSLISQHFAWFCVHWFSAGRDTMYLIYHVTSHDHLIERSCEFMTQSSLWYVTAVISLVTISIVISEILYF